MKRVITYIIILLVTAIFSGCVRDSGPILISVDITPDANIATATALSTATPTLTPTPEPELREEAYSYIEDLDYVDGDSTLFFSKWTLPSRDLQFTIDSQTYNKGIGMYVKSSRMEDGEGEISCVWNLDGKYHRISFDLGCENTLQYDEEEKYGTYNILIYADETKIWESGYNDYQYTEFDKSIDIPEGSKKLVVRLSEKRGEQGSLNVIMGSFKAYYYE